MANRTLTINHAGGDSETYTINRDKFAGVREMSIDGNTVTADHTAVPKVVAKETTFGGSKSITIKRDIEPLLSKVVGGASAAYSLRDLNDKAGSSKVVRVRRKSDNLEKDFLAKEVKDIEAWVNSQVVPPLDVRELVDGERTGALVPAAAAYSLRNLSASYTGNVVQVRRSNDNTEESFTAAQVADGTLSDWVDAENLIYTSNFSTSSTDGWGAASCIIASNIDEDADGAGQPPSDNWLRIFANGRISIRDNDPVMDDIRLLGGGRYKIEVDYYAPVSVFNHKTIAFTSAGDPSSQAINFSAGSGTRAYDLVLTDAQVSGLSDLRIGSTDTYATGTLLYFKNIRISKVESNGFVSQWYDQSGNSNHATQVTAGSQPKIVSSGSLVAGGLDFDGTDDWLQLSSTITLGTSFYEVMVSKPVEASGASNASFISPATSGGGDRTYLSTINKLSIRDSGSNIATSLTPSGTSEQIIGYSASTGLTVILDGATEVLSAVSGSKSALTIGGGSSFNIAATFNEVIIYDSDQSANRTAFEANIGETYGIDLPSGVDTGYDQVDGFVETWYDQSGNGNDATQDVAGSQPKIVMVGAWLQQIMVFQQWMCLEARRALIYLNL